jgi:hypothetical protein
MLVLTLALVACGTGIDRPSGEPGTWAGRPIGTAPAPRPGLKRAIIARATREWEFFGRQTVVMKGREESIPHVGAWEDDGSRYSGRINAYWRAVGRPWVDGADCRQPWSAAFMSWVMDGAGVPERQFPRAAAHWIYLSRMIDEAGHPGRYFVPRRVQDYSPNPGDLICADRDLYRPYSPSSFPTAYALRGRPAHCDMVVAKDGRRLEAIGGNVRNSVSRVTLELDSEGRLQPVPRRPWFLILENRM